MSIQVYVNGKFYPKEEAKISVFDHGFLYGDGVFEGIRAYNGRVFRLEEHIERLYDSARTIWLQIPISQEEMARVVVESCRVNNLRDAYIRLVVSRGPGDLGLDPRKCPVPTIICIADGITLYPAEVYEKGMKVSSVATRRTTVDSVSAQVKSLNYLNSIMAKISGIVSGHPEVILLNKEGYVCEGSGDNIFIVKKGKVITPPTYLGILNGVTRQAVMQLAAKAGYEVAEGVFTLHDVYNADECFLTGTAAEVVPVTEVDGRAIGDGKPGPVTQKLIGLYKELTQSEGTPIFE